MIQNKTDSSAPAASTGGPASKAASGQIVVGRYGLQLDPVHGAVLQTLAAEDQASPQPRPAPVVVRPQTPGDFFDRDDETTQAAAALKSGESVDLYGPVGIGKTALMAFLAQTSALDDFPDGIVYHRTAGRSADDILQSLYDDFYLSDEPFKPMREQLRHALRDKQSLVLLDDVDLKPRDVESMMNVLPRSVFVIAGKTSQLRGEACSIPLSGLPLGDAVTLLERELGDLAIDAEQLPLAQQVCKTLECRPLRIRQAAALVREDGVTLDELARKLTSPDDLKKLIIESIRELSASQQQILGVLATLDGAVVTTERLSAITKIPNALHVAEALRMRGLAEVIGEDYRLCREVTDAIREKVSPEWTIKLILYYRKLVEQYRNDPARLAPEIDAILKTLRCVIQCGLWTDAIAFVRRIESPLALAGQWDAWGEVLDAALVAARKLEDRREEAWALHQQGVRALCLDNASTAKSQLATALRMRTAQGDTAGAAATQQNLDLVKDVIAHVREPFESGAEEARSTSSAPKLALAVAAVLLVATGFFMLRKPAAATPVVEAPLAIHQVVVDETIRGGDSAKATIVLNRAVAPLQEGSTSQTVVELVVDDPTLVQVPRTVVISPGETKVVVPIETKPVVTRQRVKLTATHAGVGQESVVNLQPELSVKLTASLARGGQIVPGLVSSRAPAPAGGLRIPLEISHPAAVKGPSHVWIAPGEQDAMFELQCLPVSAHQSVKISAAYENLRPVESLTVQAGVPFVLMPPSVVGGQPFRAAVLLPRPAPPDGAKFSFVQDHPLIQTPASVTVPAGQMFAEFEAKTHHVGRSTTIAVRAVSGPIEETVHVRIRPDVRFDIEFDPNRSETHYRGTVSLPVPAPVDTQVVVHPGDAYTAPTAPVIIRRGSTTGQFPIKVDSLYPTEIAITCDGVTRRATTPTLRFAAEDLAAAEEPPAGDSDSQFGLRLVSRMQTDQAIVAVFTLHLGKPAPPGGAVVELSSSDPAIVVPETIEIPAGQPVRQFTAYSLAVADTVKAVVTAALEDDESKVPVVFPPHFDLVLNADQMPGGYATAGRLLIARGAPSEGAKFELISSDPKILRVPQMVTIPAGLQEALFEIDTEPVSANTDTEFLVRHQGVEKIVPVSLVADFEISAELERSGQATGSIRLATAAAGDGMTIGLKTNAPRVASVPSAVTIRPGEKEAKFPIRFVGAPQTVAIVGTNAGLRQTFVLVAPAPEDSASEDSRSGPPSPGRNPEG